MPTRKQRRRREKSFRHEYETVILDEEGNERPVDRDEERATREERERQRSKDKKPAPAKRGGRLGREPQPPSWQRAFRRGGVMGAVIFIAFVFILKGGSPTSRAVVAIVYAIAFIPLTYWIDRFAYRSYQRRLAKQASRNDKKR